MFEWILNMPLELQEKKKQAFLLIHGNTIYNHFLCSDSVKCKRKPIARCEICLNSITKTQQQHH